MLLLFFSVLDSQTDRKFFEQLYRKYQCRMYNIAYKILHNQTDAEDAVHNAFIHLINHLNKIKDVNENKTKSFIVIITRNAAIDIYRKNMKRREEPYEEQDVMPLVDEMNPEYIEISREAFQMRIKQIQSLDDKFADVVILKYVHELSNEQISEMLHISQDNVRLRLFRAKKMILGILRGETHGEQ